MSLLLLPWYTNVALVICALVLLGGLLSFVRVFLSLCSRALGTIPRLLDRGWLHLFGAPLSSAGSAHWAVESEVEAAGLLKTEGLPLAAWGDQVLYEPRGAHVLACGPPRSWKSTGLCMPILRSWPGAVVVSDLRHELFDQTAEDRAAYGPVYCYDPANPNNSCNLNILDSIRWGTPQAYGDAMRISHHLVVPRRDREPGPFDRPAIALLTGVVLHLHDLGEASFPAVVAWMQEPSRSQHDKVDEMLHSANPHVASAARRVLDESDRYRSIVWDAAQAPLAVFLDPTIANHSRSSDLDWQDFLAGRQPISLYLCMQFRDIDRLGVILGALVEALIALLGSPERQPRHKTLLLLDELCNLNTLTELERGISYLQGSGCQVLGCVQNLPQMLSLYGPNSPLLASFHTQVHFRPLDRLTSEYLEAMLGTSTVIASGWGDTVGRSTSVGMSGVSGGGSQGSSATWREVGRPLLTAAEIRTLPDSAALVLASGAPPIYARKLSIPQPSLVRRAAACTLAHREAVGTLAAAALVLLALRPVWTHVPVSAQAPARTLYAAMPYGNEVTAPTPSPATPPAQPALPPALQPMTTTPPPAPTPAPETPQAAPQRYQIRAVRPGSVPQLQGVIDVLPTRQGCIEMLRQRYERDLQLERRDTSLIAPMEIAWSEDFSRVDWTRRPRTGPLEKHSVWCEPEGSPAPPVAPDPLRWQLRVQQPHLQGHVVESRYEQREACVRQIAQKYEPLVESLARQFARNNVQTLQVSRDHGRLAWTIATKGGADAVHAVWCQEEKG